MTVLSYQSILKLCEGSAPLIVNHDPIHVRSAGYDLRLGWEYLPGNDGRSSGAVVTHHFTSDSEVVEIPPNQILFFRTHERLNMPHDLAATLSLKMGLLLQGLIMASQSQIDAGYTGPLFGLVYNLSNRPVALKRKEPIFRIEFRTLDEPTDKPYEGEMGKGGTLAGEVTGHISSSLHAMQQTVDRFRRQTLTGAVGIAVAVVLGAAGFAREVMHDAIEAREQARTAEARVSEVAETFNRVTVEGAGTRGKIEHLESRLIKLEERMQTGAAATTVKP